MPPKPKVQDAERLGQIKELVERAYANPGLHFDSLRRIGDMVGADTGKLRP